MFEASRGILKSFVVEIWIAHAEQNNIITVDKDLFKSQKNGIITGRCSKVTLLKFNAFLHTGMVPRFFVTDDSFLTTYKKKMGKFET